MNFMRLPDPLPDMQAWGCRVGKYTFAITLEKRDIKNWKGFTASWQIDGQNETNMIEGGPWRTRIQAEVACQNQLRKLRANDAN
jgi:hypothetical protein